MSPFREEVHAAILAMTDAGLRYGTDSPEYAQAVEEYKQALERGPLVFQPPSNGKRPGLLQRLRKKFAK